MASFQSCKQLLDPNQQYFIANLISNASTFELEEFFSGLRFSLENPFAAAGSIVKFEAGCDGPVNLDILADANSAKAKIYQLVKQYQLNPYFSHAVQREVADILQDPGLNRNDLLNYEDKAFCTIDGADTRDLDQALYLEKSNEGFKVYYALADAAFYVKPGSALFAEALNRGASYYLPGLMIPMLPRELCEGVISLNPNVLRRALVFELTLNDKGYLTNTTIVRAKIKSRAKLSFDAVQTLFDSPNESALSQSELKDSLLLLQIVGKLRIQLAEERKVVRYHRTEINIKIGDNGMVFNLLDNMRNSVELYNEQLSLLCNTEGARLLAKNDNAPDHTQAIYKIHAQPPEEKIVQFEIRLKALIQQHQLDPALWHWDPNGSKALTDYLKQLPLTGKAARITQAINRQALITNNRSQFSEHPDQHYGVGAEVYARFSAPMREIVGIFLHKELLEKSGLQAPSGSNSSDEALRDTIIINANRAKDLQNQLTKAANQLVIDQLFQVDLALASDIRHEHSGTVIGIDKEKLYILLDQPEIEVKLYIKALAKQLNKLLSINEEQSLLYQFEDNKILCGLGEAVALTVFAHDKLKNQWLFSLRRLSD